MATLINSFHLLSQSRNDLVFEFRNKSYGAYQLRKDYSTTLFKAIGLTHSLLLLLLITSYFISKRNEVKEMVLSNEQIVIPELTKEIQPPIVEEPIKVQSVPQKMTQFVQTEIVDEVVDNDIKSQDELVDSHVGVKDINSNDGSIQIPDEKPISEVPNEIVEPFTIVEEMPNFPGGDAQLLKWIRNNVQYPMYEKEMDISGKVIVRFVIGTDGSVQDCQILRGVSRGLDSEAIRVIKSMPKWNPGRQGGRPVPVYFNLPINFILN